MALELPFDVRARIRREVEAGGGRHDEPEIYGGPAGDPGLCGGPGSISWEVNGDLASVFAAGTAAIIMEVLHPSVMAGVSQQSSFGSTEGATRTIEQVKRVHGFIEGTRPDGVAYRALDPELIAWVHTCIPWAVMEAFHRYRRPLSTEERDRYLREQAVIGRMGGAEEVPESMAELEAYVERMRPLMAMTEQTRELIDFIAGDVEGELRATPRQQLERRLSIAASMSLMPAWARHLTGTYQPRWVQRLHLEPTARLQGALLRWAVPVLRCQELATERALGRPAAVPTAAA
jgi:uncharacterized protein (DUF2236 family)